MNKVFLCGHLGQDPDLKTTKGGTAVCSLRLATNERRKDRDGEWTDHTEWHTVVAWSGTAEAVNKHCRKGSKVTVEGRLQTREWEDKEGVKRYTTEIVADSIDFMSAPEEGGGKGNGRGRDDDRGRGRDDDRGRGRDDDRGARGGGRGRNDDRGRGRDADTY